MSYLSVGKTQLPFGRISQACSSLASRRWLNLHEYQSKDVLESFGVRVQRGQVAANLKEAQTVLQQLQKDGVKKFVLKAQVLAGGRGKGKLSSGLQGGVQIDSNPKKIVDYASRMLGYQLVTKQTDANGEIVRNVMIVEAAEIKKELYLAFLLDRSRGGPVIIASTEGGVEIEEVAETAPEKVHKIPIKDVVKGIQDDECEAVVKALGLYDNLELRKDAKDQIQKLYKLFVQRDATQVEINPLALVDDPQRPIVCVDAKMNFDDNAKYRQKDLFALEDVSTRDKRELAAEEWELNFVGLDGQIGCLVNGAGLAMATMDILKLSGGEPANFLDVGGGAQKDQVAEAFRILQSDRNVKSIFVNIFGGIMRCNIIAQGMIDAAKMVGLKIPLVVRLVGTNEKEGRALIDHAKDRLKLNIHSIADFKTAGEYAVKVAMQ